MTATVDGVAAMATTKKEAAMAESDATAVPETPEPDAPEDDLGDPGKKAIDSERKARRDAEKRVKAVEGELEKLRQQTMTDTEKAIAQARTEGKAEAMHLLGAANVESAFAIAASGRLESEQLKVLLQGVNHGAFLNDDGTVDDSSVSTFIDGIAPKPDPNRRVDLGQGARQGGVTGPGKAVSADPLVNALTALVNK